MAKVVTRIRQLRMAALLVVVSAVATVLYPAHAQSTRSLAVDGESWRTILTPEDVQDLPPVVEHFTKRLQQRYDDALRQPPKAVSQSIARQKSGRETRVRYLNNFIPKLMEEIELFPTKQTVRQTWIEHVGEREALLSFAPLGGVPRPLLVAARCATQPISEPKSLPVATGNDALLGVVKNPPSKEGSWRDVVTPDEAREMERAIATALQKLRMDFALERSKKTLAAIAFKKGNEGQIQLLTQIIGQGAAGASLTKDPGETKWPLRKGWLGHIAERDARLTLEREWVQCQK